MSQPSNIISKIFNVTSWVFFVPAILCAIAAIITTVWTMIYAGGAGANSGASVEWTYLFGMLFGAAFLGLGLVGAILGFIGKVTRIKVKA
jgi:hypothetical protein